MVIHKKNKGFKLFGEKRGCVCAPPAALIGPKHQRRKSPRLLSFDVVFLPKCSMSLPLLPSAVTGYSACTLKRPGSGSTCLGQKVEGRQGKGAVNSVSVAFGGCQGAFCCHYICLQRGRRRTTAALHRCQTHAGLLLQQGDCIIQVCKTVFYGIVKIYDWSK